jgi:hypothetical protein
MEWWEKFINKVVQKARNGCLYIITRKMNWKIWKVRGEVYKQYILSGGNNFSSLSIEIL